MAMSKTFSFPSPVAQLPTRIGLVAILAIAAILPFCLRDYHLFQATQVLIFAIALLGLNILTGYNGQISLGHGAFYAIGAYTTAILLDKTAIPYWGAVPISGAVCLVAGFLFGLPALRFEGLYLALATFALAVATPQLLKFHGFEPWTGGVQGILISLPDAPFDLPITPNQFFYLYCLGWTLILCLGAWNLLHGRIGRALVAIRDHPTAAAGMGVDTARYKSLTFGVSALYTGIAGGLGALLAQFVSPDSFPSFLSITFIVGSVVGGIVSIAGSFFGAAFIVFVPNFASQISKAAPWAIYGAFLILMMYVMPSGAIGIIRAARDRLSRMSGGHAQGVKPQQSKPQ
jgi:branched-chain amino acid transport system permease protein